MYTPGMFVFIIAFTFQRNSSYKVFLTAIYLLDKPK